MPAKLNMVIISNRNLLPPPPQQAPLNAAALSTVPSIAAKPSSALNAPIISRIHTTRPGCGSCGRK
jgi:hypothetical protein